MHFLNHFISGIGIKKSSLKPGYSKLFFGQLPVPIQAGSI